MIETYSYAADGKRRQKVTASGTTTFIWDGENVLAEQDQNLVTRARYTQFPSIWGGLVSQRQNGVSSYYGFDLAGNTRALLSPAAVITDSYSYKAFGPELPGSGSTTNPYRYCGVLGYYRDNSARQYVRARHLRVDSGRWMNCDPYGFADLDVNLYRYIANRPLAGGDPSGMFNLIDLLGSETNLPIPAGISIPLVIPVNVPPIIGYGKYCGPNYGPAPVPPCPIDPLDACCFAHDSCYAACIPPGTWRSPFNGTSCTRTCDSVLCLCAAGPVCAGLTGYRRWHCLAYRKGVVALFCRPRKPLPPTPTPPSPTPPTSPPTPPTSPPTPPTAPPTTVVV
jgi:RHS repeat-associated protein